MKNPFFKTTDIKKSLSPDSWRGGFTLLELTISITLIGIIVLIVAGALRLGYRSVESGEKRVESLNRIRSSFNIIDSQIQSYMPLSYDDEGIRKFYFQGENNFLQFTTNYSLWGGIRGYVIASYTVKTRDDGKQDLYVSENLIGLEGTRETRLFEAREKIYFEYFYKDPTEEEGSWVDIWTDEVSFPEKIRLHLVDGGNDFSMIIPLRVKSPVSMTTSRFVHE